jgi:hypothetical protein
MLQRLSGIVGNGWTEKHGVRRSWPDLAGVHRKPAGRRTKRHSHLSKHSSTDSAASPFLISSDVLSRSHSRTRLPTSKRAVAMSPSDLEKGDASNPSRRSRLSTYLKQDICRRHSDLILLACSFISGLCDSGAFNAWSCFVSMQTGMSLKTASIGLLDHKLTQ